MSSNLMVHAGGRVVSVEELASMPAPESTRSWFPVRHAEVLDAACQILNEADFRVQKLCVATARDDQRMFATIDLRSEIQEGVCLSIGVRSSIDKSFPLSLLAGSRVFVCDNLAFIGDIKVNAKHTKYGSRRWQDGIRCALGGLDSFIQAERGRVELLRSIPLTDVQVHHLCFVALMAEVVNHTQAIDAAGQWHDPIHPEFEPRTAWSLYNCFTEVMKPLQVRSFDRFAANSMRLYPLLLNHVGRN